MQDHYEKGIANHSAPSFALGAMNFSVKRKQGNRWAGYRASKNCNRDGDAVVKAEGKIARSDNASSGLVLRSRRPPRLEISCKRTGRPAGYHTIGRCEKAARLRQSRTRQASLTDILLQERRKDREREDRKARA